MNRRTEEGREDMRNKNGKIVDLKYKSKEDSLELDNSKILKNEVVNHGQ